jgi:RHS repeat-associated protein
MTSIPANLRDSSDPLALNWDFDNRMKSADTDNDSTADVFYEFDALGRRVARNDGTQDTIFVQVGQQTIADYVSGTAAASPEYIYAWGSYIDELLLRTEPSGTDLHYHRNQQYSTYAVTNSSGSIQERYAYSPYGELTIADAVCTVRGTSALDTRYTYTGREWDAKLSLYQFRARMYNATSGRFCSRDPIKFAGGETSLYLYLRRFLLSRIDWAGKKPDDPVKLCKLAVTNFLALHQDVWDKQCGKDRYTYPFKLEIKCELDNENAKCKRKPNTLGFHTCIDAGRFGDTERITICAEHKSGGKAPIVDDFFQTIHHEFVHALDSCSCNNDCGQSTFFDTESGRASACETLACAEIRAYSYGVQSRLVDVFASLTQSSNVGRH